MTERRRRPTPFFSRYWWTGRRREGRDTYVDRYTRAEVAVVALILLLALADLVLTIVYLERGGEEANPVMQVALEGGYLWFAVVKMGVTAAGVLFVLAHIRFGRVRYFLLLLLVLSIALLGYHVYLQVMLDMHAT